MEASISPELTEADIIVLQNLANDIDSTNRSTTAGKADRDDETSIGLLAELTDKKSDKFQPTVFTRWDLKDIATPNVANQSPLQSYIRWAEGVVRRPTDVVFLTHLILYLTTSVPSAIYLYYRFSWLHGICHFLMQAYYCGPFTLMLHNHIHNNGILASDYAWFDRTWPYILEPLMGHTWDSYFWHHVKHHHTENNGPNDLSSTIRYQRDDLVDFLTYVGRFVFFIWIELPVYFLRKKKPAAAMKTLTSEIFSYGSIYFLAMQNAGATTFVFILPLVLMRIAMMVGNWGQHALVDEVDPDSDFRSSITLIDVPSNRHCFNDGYHTSHHLNPRRHWRDHPAAFLKSKNQYKDGGALVFQNIDYIFMTIRLLRKDYLHLARCLVPVGDQIGMSEQEIADMLRTKTRRFTEEEIRQKYGSK
ncbi:MAG: hypothetical protein M1827_002008 [Pycnora praestabilis]|nr:MAG: hypothetical protein M1827_002008 [Pycnora praestabilis]